MKWQHTDDSMPFGICGSGVEKGKGRDERKR